MVPLKRAERLSKLCAVVVVLPLVFTSLTCPTRSGTSGLHASVAC